MSEDERWERLIKPIARNPALSSTAPRPGGLRPAMPAMPRATMPPMPMPTMPRPSNTSVRPSAGRTATSGGFDYGAAYGASQGTPSGSGGFSPLGSLGQGAMGFLKLIDKPRSAVNSLNKELQDAWQGEGFSFKDLRSQYDRNMGYQEVLDDVGMAGGWQRTALGIFGDIASDPLTYFSFGTAIPAKALAKQIAKYGTTRAAAQLVADQGLRVAVQTGSSKMISTALAKSAIQAGFIDPATSEIRDVAVQRLLVAAAERGRGALTPRGLVNAGITRDVANQLGIPALGKRVSFAGRGFAVPGSTGYANLAEGFKGSAKRAVRLRPGASVGRNMFIAEVAGTRAIAKRIYDQSLPLGQRAAAVLARESSATSLSVSRKWGATTENRIRLALQPHWYRVNPDEGVRLTDNIEMGVVGDAEDAWRLESVRVLQEQSNAGVDIGDFGPNFVPHQQTDEFANLTRKDAAAADWAVQNLRTQEGFEKVRTLKAGDSFYDDMFGGVPLEFGTIREINERAQVVFGVKLFKDDLRDIVPGYIASATKTMQRAQQVIALEAVGLARPVATRMVREATNDPKLIAQLESAKKRLRDAENAEQVELRRGGQIRRDAIPQAVGELRRRYLHLSKQVNQLRKESLDSARAVRTAQDRVESLKAQEAPLQAAVAATRKALIAARGEKKVLLRQQLVENEKKLREVATSLVRAMFRVDDLTDVQRTLKVGEKAVRTQEFWAQRLEKVAADSAELAEDIKHLLPLRTPLGQGGTVADLRLRQAQQQWDLLLLKQTDAVDAADAAAASYALVLVDNNYAIDQIQRVMAELDRGVNAGRVGKKPSKLPPNVRTPRLMDLKQQMDTVMEVLRRADAGDPSDTARLIAVMEASAAKSDLAVAASRQEIQTLTGMIDALKNRMFVDKIVPVVEDGMVSIGRDLQIPGWLDEALTLRRIADEAPEIHRYLKKFYNLFKGYAILRPGFHVRNAYSAMFGMYLEAGAGSLVSATEYFRFFKLVEKNPDNYMALAVQRFGAERAARLDAAWTATAGSGSGQITGELNSTAFRQGTLNPFSEQNVALKSSRRAGQWVENRVRGAHAYDVLNRGGTMEQATEILNKWQFNYTDITTFDQKAKLANPFWTFFSRNIALQSQEWVRSAARLNRSVENVRRNVGYGLDEDESVPEWYKKSGAIPLFKGREGTGYLFTDLPAVVWPGDLDDLTKPSEMSKLIGTFGPWISIPYELAAGKQAFSGIPIREGYEPLPGGLGMIPGIEGLPFVEQGAGGPMISSAARSALMSTFPILGTTERLFPSTDALRERALYSRINYLTGVGLRENTPRSQRGEEYRLLLEEQAEQRKRDDLGMVP